MTPAKTFVVALCGGLVAGAAAFGLQMAVTVWLQQAQEQAIGQQFGSGLS